MSRFSGRQLEGVETSLPAMHGKWPSFDRLTPAVEVSEDSSRDNPFHYVQVHGPELAQQGMDSDGIMAAAIALGGLPKPLGERGNTNLQSYAEHIHELHGTQAGGEQ